MQSVLHVLTRVLTKDCWVSGLCISSRILNTNFLVFGIMMMVEVEKSNNSQDAHIISYPGKTSILKIIYVDNEVTGIVDLVPIICCNRNRNI